MANLELSVSAEVNACQFELVTPNLEGVLTDSSFRGASNASEPGNQRHGRA